MLLHRLVDKALTPLLKPMQLEHVTEDFVTVDASDLSNLIEAYDDPQAALTSFGPRAMSSGALICEPALSSAILSKIWRSNRNEGAKLTEVEGEILRQFIARLVGAWASSWTQEQIKLIPELTMAGALSSIEPQLSDGTWHIVRTAITAQGSTTPLGVLLFCYPTNLMPQLTQQASSILWRSRIKKGLTEKQKLALQARLTGPLRDLRITTPIKIRQNMTLGMLNELERGDIVAFDTNSQGAIALDALGREIFARLARTENHTALVITETAEDHAMQTASPIHTTYEQPPETSNNEWEQELVVS